MSPILIASLMRPSGGTGGQSHVTAVGDHLADAALPFEVLTPFGAPAPLLLPALAARRVIRPLSPTAAVWWYRRGHALLLEAQLRRSLGVAPDAVIYAQCPVSADVALRVRTTHPVVMVAHFNISQADEWADKGEIRRDGRLFRSILRLEERVLPRLDGLVHVSEAARRQLEQRVPAVADVPTVVVPNPVREPVGSTEEPLADLVTVGSLEPRKNHAYLLDVLAAADQSGRRFTLTVVGDGPERRRLEAQARRLGLAGRVTFTGYLADPRPVIARHAVYCHTSRMESFGIVLVEAMAEGLPVLAAPVGGVPEVVRENVDGVFWPLDNARAAAQCLIALMEDEAGRSAMAAAARAHAREYSTGVLGPRLLEFLAGVAGPARRVDPPPGQVHRRTTDLSHPPVTSVTQWIAEHGRRRP